MKLSLAAIISAVALIPFSHAAPVQNAGQAIMRYDTRYDNLDAPVDDLACSNGDHGLKTKGHNTLRTLIKKPDVDVGAVFGVQWNSVGCGKCYRIMYNVESMYIIAVDRAGEGFNLSKRAFDRLTNGRAEELGSAQVAWEEVEPKFCGI